MHLRRYQSALDQIKISHTDSEGCPPHLLCHVADSSRTEKALAFQSQASRRSVVLILPYPGIHLYLLRRCKSPKDIFIRHYF